MSLSIALADQATTHIAAMVPAAGGDLFSKINTMISSATGSAKFGGGLLAVLFVLVTAWKVKGAIAGVIAGFIGAALFGWAINNVNSTDVSAPISETIKGAPAIPSGPISSSGKTGGAGVASATDAASVYASLPDTITVRRV